MKNMRRIGASILVVAVLLTVSAFAATEEFSGQLPAKHGDTEVSTIARKNGAAVKPYFEILIDQLGGNGSSVRAWTEVNATGLNVSSPYNEVDKVVYTKINYSSGAAPAKGLDVTLNLDNPIYTTTAVSVGGEWTPN